jgi:hypothetical protein
MIKKGKSLSFTNRFGFALAISIMLVLLISAFTNIPANIAASFAPEEDKPAYCSPMGQLNVVNKYGTLIPISDGISINRVTGDMVNLYIEGVSEDEEVLPTIITLSGNGKQVVNSYFNLFSKNGYFSFYPYSGIYAVGYILTQEQYNACGSSAFENAIETTDAVYVIQYQLKIRMQSPTQQPREYSNNALPTVPPGTPAPTSTPAPTPTPTP